MPTLDSSLRDQLASVIGKENADTGARIIAEAGAKAAIEALAVHLPSPYGHLDGAQKQLRNRLRARARQLGDIRYTDGRHEIGRLVEQAAYEHWHRMLFARFLAENDLLIHPGMEVAVTLDECSELAASEGAADGWELAGRYASRMLPQIFRPDDPLLAVRFAIDDVKKLEALLDSLPAALFTASDSLGWCYQFWQARKKKEVNASEVKIGADELPAVTQLFTEPYMVQFLLHNTLGAWWVGAGRALPAEMPYLRVLEDRTPAAGTFEGWPRLARELKVLDPCCGSGHFLVAAFEILVAFRIAEEGLTAREACDAVLRDNLFGLEIDARCVQIAAFALAMAAWTYPEAGGYRPLAAMNVACSGLAISAKKEEWERLGGDNARLRAGMGRMWELFSDAQVLGSLADPARNTSMLAAGLDELKPLLDIALAKERDSADPEAHERVVSARALADAALVLSSRFTLIATNVPFLARARHDTTLRRHADDFYADFKADLSTLFLGRAFGLLASGGTMGTVSPYYWLFLPSYLGARTWLLQHSAWEFAALLGTGAFATISGENVNVSMTIISARSSPPGHLIRGLDSTTCESPSDKAHSLIASPVLSVEQASILRNPGRRVSFEELGAGSTMRDMFHAAEGLSTGDRGRYVMNFWEVLSNPHTWQRLQNAGGEDIDDGGFSEVVRWEGGRGSLSVTPGARIQGEPAWGRQGVLVCRVGSLRASPYLGDKFDKSCVAIFPKAHGGIDRLWAFCSSGDFRDAVRKLDKKTYVTTSVFLDVASPSSTPTAASLAHTLSLMSRNPTQWLYTGFPRGSTAPLHVAVARLLGYRWPDQKPDALDAHADKDGIVCIPALRGERPAADRLADLLAASWGKDWHPQTITDLLAAVGHAGTLEEWLRDTFFKLHCELFHHRPFIWHVWDGHRKGFSALVNYHKLDHEGLKSLTYSYLGDWIRTQEIEAKAGKSGAGDKLAKAKALQQRLAAILEGEAPLDVFVRWKPIEQQPIGWHPDLDDGVRLNIRPFLTVADVSAKGAGVLRWKPNITWGKDRGKNPPGSPWGEDRDNDVHLTLAAKRAAREES